MAIELKAGQVVILRGGTYASATSVGRVYGDPTPRKVKIQSWDQATGDWGVHHGRDRDAVVAVLASDADPAAVHRRLVKAASDHYEARKAAGAQYQARVAEIAQGIAPGSSTGEVERALLVFAACARDIKPDEPDDSWARFRLLASDYRRAHALYVKLTGREPPFPDEAHAALAPATDQENQS